MTDTQQRRRNAPTRTSDYVAHDIAPSGQGSEDLSLKSKLKRVYASCIDAVLSSMAERFDQNDIAVVKNIGKLIVSSASRSSVIEDKLEIKKIEEQIGPAAKFFNVEKLTVDLNELPVHIKLYNTEMKEQSKVQIKELTSVATVEQVLNVKPVSKTTLTELHKLIVLYKTYAMSSATAERSFSAMRRIKSWLRSRMSDNMLTNCMFAMIHKYRIDAVDIPEVMRDFISVSTQRQNYFGTA